MSEIEDRIVIALAKAFKADTVSNPQWDRKAEWEAWKLLEEYPVPKEISATIEQMRERTPMIVFTAGDGLPSMRSATLAEIAEVTTREFEPPLLPPWHVWDDTGRVWRLEPIHGACPRCGHAHPEVPEEGCPDDGPPVMRLVPADEEGALDD